jgi:hypothetical protein
LCPTRLRAVRWRRERERSGPNDQKRRKEKSNQLNSEKDERWPASTSPSPVMKR